MPWIERHGDRCRVRYWTDTGKAATLGTFPDYDRAAAFVIQFSAPGQPTTPSVAMPTPVSFGPFGMPAPSSTLFEAWVKRWWPTVEVGANTAAGYFSLLKNHLLPRWSTTALHEITPTDVTVWLKSLRTTYKPATVSSIGKLLSLILSAAVLERLIPGNPVRIPRQRGRQRSQETYAFATEADVVSIARRVSHLAGPNQGLLIITAAYTGMRWGELAALRRPAHDPQAATLTVHAEHGNLHEVNGHHSLGTPKTAASVRTVTLPPFLNTLITENTDSHRREHLFTTSTGRLLRRSTFQRRYWAPATRGTTLADGTVWAPITPGLTFHGLRHTQKTWLIEDDIPDVAQARRLGHTLDNDIDDIYSHVAATLNTRILAALEARWQRSLTTPDASSEDVTPGAGAV
ncbi:tyrosine-type recombinase/integrase [Streptomyces sp. NBC_00006]|uniref:tyrosine-type recombinase/integrase n=1 Tax=Streptomyces sp. NBC_00006 TaxID=2975619 RepID=UPI002256514C|nr:tyrosine-type recombinase/integrase [Streptomyces sp. NBC_00006]MCX5535775.1 tyrosine-type recombinase/integrase [Streptomyces sp. NBC_00006]